MSALEQVVPEGYKQTLAGIIPEDWEVTTLEQAANFLDGLRRPVKSGERAKIKGQYPYYGASGIVDYVNDYIFDGNFILLGEDGENILSRNLPLAFKASGKIWVNNHAHVMTPKDEFHIDYLVEYLESLDYSLLNSGTAQPKLNKQACLSINVVKPPKEEQTAIANALSDVDALLTELEKLIAKKQAIKTATMQQLLTGKTRLPQFAYKEVATDTEGEKQGQPKGSKPSELGEIPEDWDVQPLSKLSTYINDGTHHTPTYTRDGIPFYSVENVSANDFYNVKYISEEEHKKLIKRCKPEKGDILMTRIGTLGVTRVIDWEVDASIYVSLALIKLRQEVRPEYVYSFSKSSIFKQEVEKRSLVNATPQKINMIEIGQVPILFPKNEEEQTAIATILSDMDNEIQTLEQRLAKTRQIKQGMMQELLTGRTRLPISKGAV